MSGTVESTRLMRVAEDEYLELQELRTRVRTIANEARGVAIQRDTDAEGLAQLNQELVAQLEAANAGKYLSSKH